MPGYITGADVVMTLAIEPLFLVPQQLQGFGVDDVYDIPRIRSVEVAMGVDGVLSGGFVYSAVPQEITLQGDSASNRIFDVWWTQMQAAMTPYSAMGTIRLPGVSTKFVQLRGFLTGYSPSPAVKRTIQPRKYEITWARVLPAPTQI